MKLNTDSLTTIFGLVASAAQFLGQFGVINQPTSGAISAIAVALLGYFSNKKSPDNNHTFLN